MSTRTIAVDSEVYDRLAGVKRKGESFSKAIDRLLDEVSAAHTGGDILRGLEGFPALPEEDARTMLAVVADNRRSESWAIQNDASLATRNARHFQHIPGLELVAY